MKRLVLTLGFVYFLLSCSNNNSDTIKESFEYSVTHLLGRDSLIIKAHFSDCGESRGHNEQIILNSNGKQLIAQFISDSVDCSESPVFERQIVEDKTYYLNREIDKDIVAFLQGLIAQSFQDRGITNAGNHYFITSSSGDVVIKYHDYLSEWDGYYKLRQKIKE